MPEEKELENSEEEQKSSSYDPKSIEKEINEYWEKNGTEKKSITINKGKERFYFLDGPPYATGSIHMGTAWNKIIKD